MQLLFKHSFVQNTPAVLYVYVCVRACVCTR